MTRILYVVSGGHLGGIASGLLGLVRHLDPHRYHATVLFTKPGRAPECFRQARLAPYVGSAPSFFRTLIRQEGIHLVHSCDAAHEGARAAYEAGLPHVWFIGGTLEATFAGISRAALPAFRALIDHLSDAIVVPSKALARDEFSRVPPSKVQVIPWGVETDDRPRGERPHATPLIGMVGNFYPAKRHSDFILAAGRIHRRLPRARFVIAGVTPGTTPRLRASSRAYRRRLLTALRRQGLSSTVRLVSFPHRQQTSWYRRLDLLVCPSHEGMSQAVLEAAVCGVPVVAVNEGGCAELLQRNRSGLLVPYRNPGALAEAAIRLLSNPTHAHRLGRALEHHVRARFSASRQAVRFERLYDAILHDRRQQP